MKFEIGEVLTASDLINLGIRNEMVIFVACRNPGCIKANMQKQMRWYTP